LQQEIASSGIIYFRSNEGQAGFQYDLIKERPRATAP